MRNMLTRPLVAATLLFCCAAEVHAGAHRDNGGVVVVQIPFSDWLDAQTTSLVAFQARQSSMPFDTLANVGVVDYAGKLAADRHLSYGFSATGSVMLMQFTDGTGELLVNVDFTNAINYAYNVHGVLIFGYTAGNDVTAENGGNVVGHGAHRPD